LYVSEVAYLRRLIIHLWLGMSELKFGDEWEEGLVAKNLTMYDQVDYLQSDV